MVYHENAGLNSVLQIEFKIQSCKRSCAFGMNVKTFSIKIKAVFQNEKESLVIENKKEVMFFKLKNNVAFLKIKKYVLKLKKLSFSMRTIGHHRRQPIV